MRMTRRPGGLPMVDKDRRKAPRALSHIPIDLYDPKGRAAVTGEGQWF